MRAYALDLPDIDDWAARSREPVAAVTADGTVLLSLKEQKYFTLNATAAAIWTRLETPSRLRRVRDEIAQEFHAPLDEVEAALLEFVASLAAQGIVTVRKHHFSGD